MPQRSSARSQQIQNAASRSVERLIQILGSLPTQLRQMSDHSSLMIHTVQIAMILALLVAGTLIVYYTGGTGFAYPYLLLLPVILSSSLYRIWGGVWCAVVAGLLIGPFMPLNTTENLDQSTSNWLARLIMFIIIAWFTGSVFQRIRNSLSTDDRTSLPNYKALHEDVRRALLQKRLSRSIRKDPMVMVVIVRLVDLWEVTEAFGVDAADRATELLARELKTLSTLIHNVYLFGSSELALLVTTHGDGDNKTIGLNVIAQIESAGEKNLTVNNTAVRIQLSAGSYITTDAETDPALMIKRARFGLITALELGHFHHSFEVTDDQRLESRIQLISRVRDALANNEFELFYQPKTDLRTGKPAGCEGLIRWADGAGGFISPGAFMPKVEKTTLITPVTRHVIHLACDLIRRKPEATPVSINWAAQNLLDDQLIDWLGETVNAFGIVSTDLEIEITEGALINDPLHARENVGRLRKMGFPVSLDDFGTGYSSFQYLTQLPITGLKIDRAFVINLEYDPTARKVIKSIIELAHSLDLSVTVEGLETSEQCNIVSSLGADYAQGYYLAKPLAEHHFLAYLAEPESRLRHTTVVCRN